MPRLVPNIDVGSNNKKIIEVFQKVESQNEYHFKAAGDLHNSSYLIYLVDLNADITNISQDIINLLQDAQKRLCKIAICLLFKDKVDTEKVHYLKKLLNSLNQTAPSYRMCFIRDLYQDVLNEPVTKFDYLLADSLVSLQWKTSIKGKNQYFPLHIDDLATALIKVLYLNNTAGKSFWIFGDQYSDLEIGYLIKNSPTDSQENYDLEFVLPNSPEASEYVSAANDTQIALNFRPRVDFSRKIKTIIEKYQVNSQTYSKLEKTKTKNILNLARLVQKRLTPSKQRQSEFKLKRRLTSLLIKAVVLVASAYLISAALFTYSLYREYDILDQSLELISRGMLTESVDKMGELSTYNKISTVTYEPIRPVIHLINQHTNEEITNVFTFNKYLLLSLKNLQQTYVLANKIYINLTDSQSTLNMSDSILALQSNLSQLYDNVRQINISLESNKLPSSLTKKIRESEQYKNINLIENQVTQSMKLLEIAPHILASDKPINLGLIIQDQDEIRATGGVIKQLIVLKISGGKVMDVMSYHPADIDTIAEGSAKSPEMLARVTGSDNLRFENMNYPADFSQTAQYISWFLERTVNLDLDFVAGINKSLFENMLDEERGVEVSGKRYQRNDLRSSNADTDPSKVVVDHYMGLFRSGKLPITTLGRSLLLEMEHGNLLLYAKDESSQASISRLPLSGVVSGYQCLIGLNQYADCINQTTYLNESNFSNIPLNNSLKRDTTHKITIGENIISHEYQLKYKSESNISSLTGDYRIIYQLFAPSGSLLKKIEIDNQAVQDNDLIKLTHNLFEYYQIPVTFPISGEHNINIVFDTPLSRPFNATTTALSFTEIRQPGLSEQGTVLLIKTPENLKPLVISQPIQSLQGFIAAQLPQKTATFGLGLGN